MQSVLIADGPPEMIHFWFLVRVEVTCYHRVETSLFAKLELLQQELVEEKLCFRF